MWQMRLIWSLKWIFLFEREGTFILSPKVRDVRKSSWIAVPVQSGVSGANSGTDESNLVFETRYRWKWWQGKGGTAVLRATRVRAGGKVKGLFWKCWCAPLRPAEESRRTCGEDRVLLGLAFGSDEGMGLILWLHILQPLPLITRSYV